MQSIFVLFQYYNLGSRRTIATKMYRQVISYYSSFDNAQQGLAYIVENAHKSTYCYVIEEFSYDVIHANYPQSLSVYSYNSRGTLNDYSQIPDPVVGSFHGRNPEKIKYRIGEIVRYLDTGNYLKLGIIARLPVTSVEYVKLLKKYTNGLYLDRSDDSYCVLDASDDEYGHAHPPCWAVFPVTKVRDELQQLLMRKLKIDNIAYNKKNQEKYSLYYPYDDPFDYKPEFINNRRGLFALDDLKYYRTRRSERMGKELIAKK